MIDFYALARCQRRENLTFLGELFELVRARCAGRMLPNDSRLALEIERESYTHNGVTGTFSDPYNGRRYRIAVVPEEYEIELVGRSATDAED